MEPTLKANQMKLTKILKITRMGDPVLATPAKAVIDPKSHETHEIIDCMLATAQDCGNLVGLAAPQVKIPYRISIFFVPEEKGEEVPLTILINPTWEPLSEGRVSFRARVGGICTTLYPYPVFVSDNSRGYGHS
jgi:peptide deformylase